MGRRDIIKILIKMFHNVFALTVTDAVNMFLHQSLMVDDLPFELKQSRYNTETEIAMQEAQAKTYKSIAEMNADIDTMLDEE